MTQEKPVLDINEFLAWLKSLPEDHNMVPGRISQACPVAQFLDHLEVPNLFGLGAYGRVSRFLSDLTIWHLLFIPRFDRSPIKTRDETIKIVENLIRELGKRI